MLTSIIFFKGNYSELFWTSGSDQHNPKVFYWESTGVALGPLFNWAPGQPEYFGSWNCVALGHLDSYQWHDYDCGVDTMRYICEKRGNPLNLKYFVN